MSASGLRASGLGVVGFRDMVTSVGLQGLQVALLLAALTLIHLLSPLILPAGIRAFNLQAGSVYDILYYKP